MNGYTMNGQECVPQVEGADRSTSCTAPLLPNTFNSAAFLRSSDRMHLFGDYYVDLQQSGHNASFALSGESIFTSFVGSVHSLRVSMSLLLPNETRISSTVAPDGQYLYQVLPVGDYVLEFGYSAAEEASTSSCTTINMELAVRTVKSIQEEASLCDSSVSSAPPTNVEVGLVPMPAGLHFQRDDPYQVANSESEFYSYSFRVAGEGIPANFQSVLTIHLGYQFIAGSLGVTLERNSKDRCSSVPSNCLFGSRMANQQVLKAVILPETDYTVWLTKTDPSAGLPDVPCIRYTFSLDLELAVKEESEWHCESPRLPRSLNSPSVMKEDGSFHVVDRYFLPSTSHTTLNVTKRSLFRISVATEERSVTLKYKSLSEVGWNEASLDGVPSLSIVLEPGSFSFELQTFGISNALVSGQICHPSAVEMAFESLPTEEESTCKSVSPLLPAILPEFVVPPYSFGIPTEPITPVVYTAYFEEDSETDIVYSLSFDLQESAQLTVGVASDFLLNNLYLQVRGASSWAPVQGRNFYNYNFIDALLPPDNYTLSVIRSSPHRVAGALVANCADFNFQMTLSDHVLCREAGEPLPNTLNSVRFLGGRGRSFNYFSPAIRAPVEFVQFHYTTESIPIEVEVESLFRSSIIPRDGVLPQLSIQRFAGGQFVTVAKAILTGSERPTSLAFVLVPGEYYELLLEYYVQGGSFGIKSCPTFPLQFSVEPVVQQSPLCPHSGGDHFNPPLPEDLPVESYLYDSEEMGENLYFQQISKKSVGHTFTMTLHDTANVHLELTFDFVSTDMVLHLKRPDDLPALHSTRAWRSEERRVGKEC